MAAKPAPKVGSVDRLMKAMMVFARTVDYVLETRAVDAAMEHPMSSSKVKVLRLLAHRSGQTSSQVARYLGVSKPAVSQIIDSMVADKLVTRKTAKSDRREINLHLTDKGKQLGKAVLREQRHYVRSVLKGVNGTGCEKWIETMDGMSQALGHVDQAFEHFCMQCGGHAAGACVLVGGETECSFVRSHSNGFSSARKNGSKKRAVRR